jgi:hypothetical protein
MPERTSIFNKTLDAPEHLNRSPSTRYIHFTIKDVPAIALKKYWDLQVYADANTAPGLENSTRSSSLQQPRPRVGQGVIKLEIFCRNRLGNS